MLLLLFLAALITPRIMKSATASASGSAGRVLFLGLGVGAVLVGELGVRLDVRRLALIEVIIE
jgi:hypothetical protein